MRDSFCNKKRKANSSTYKHLQIPAMLSKTREQPCQGWGRGFESLRPLQRSNSKKLRKTEAFCVSDWAEIAVSSIDAGAPPTRVPSSRPLCVGQVLLQQTDRAGTGQRIEMEFVIRDKNV